MADHGLCEAGKAGRAIHNGCVTKMCLFSEQKDDQTTCVRVSISCDPAANLYIFSVSCVAYPFHERTWIYPAKGKSLFVIGSL